MKRLVIITLAALLVQSAAFAELSVGEPVRMAAPDATALSLDTSDAIVSRPAKFASVELPRTAPDFAAVLPKVKLRARWKRPADLSRNSETAAFSQYFRVGTGTLIYLFAATMILYVVYLRLRSRVPETGPRVLLARPTAPLGASASPGAVPLSTLRK